MKTRRNLPHRSAGFTLMELIVAVTIVGILASLAAPSFKDMMVDQRVKSASFEITAALTRARSEARKQNGNVTLTPTSTSTPPDWAGGWTITGPDGATLGTQDAHTNITIRITSPSPGPPSIVYNRTGRSSSAADIKLQVDSSAAGSTPSPLCRLISVGVTGLPKSVKGSCT